MQPGAEQENSFFSAETCGKVNGTIMGSQLTAPGRSVEKFTYLPILGVGNHHFPHSHNPHFNASGERLLRVCRMPGIYEVHVRQNKQLLKLLVYQGFLSRHLHADTY